MSLSQSVSRATRSGRNVKKPKRFQSSSSEKELNADDVTTDDDLEDFDATDDDLEDELSSHEKTEEEKNEEMHASMIDMFEGMAEEIVILQTEDPTNKLLLRTEERIKEDSTNVTKEKVDQHLHINDNDSPSIQHDNNSNTKPVAHKSDNVIPSKKFIPITSNVIQVPPLSVHALKNNKKNANNLAAQQLNSNNGKAKFQQTKPGTSPKDDNNYQYQRIENLIVTSLRRIEEKQNERMDNLENMLRQREPMVANAPRNNNIGNHNPRPPGFSITSLDGYDAYEDDDDNQESQNQLRQYLAQEEAGSSNCKDSIRKFYDHTFSPSIFKKLQWTSHNLKNRPEMRGLFNSKISNVFFEAIHECQHDKRLTSDEFSKHMTATVEAGKQSLRDSHKRNQRNNPAPRRSCATAINQSMDVLMKMREWMQMMKTKCDLILLFIL